MSIRIDTNGFYCVTLVVVVYFTIYKCNFLSASKEILWVLISKTVTAFDIDDTYYLRVLLKNGTTTTVFSLYMTCNEKHFLYETHYHISWTNKTHTLFRQMLENSICDTNNIIPLVDVEHTAITNSKWNIDKERKIVDVTRVWHAIPGSSLLEENLNY